MKYCLITNYKIRTGGVTSAAIAFYENRRAFLFTRRILLCLKIYLRFVEVSTYNIISGVGNRQWEIYDTSGARLYYYNVQTTFARNVIFTGVFEKKRILGVRDDGNTRKR